MSYVTKEQLENMLNFLTALAQQTIPDEGDEGEDYFNFSPYDYFGGNFDDAYKGGVVAGRIDLARELLATYLKLEE